MAHFALDADRTTHLLHDFLTDGEAQASALTIFVGILVQFPKIDKQLFLALFRNTNARIFDDHLDFDKNGIAGAEGSGRLTLNLLQLVLSLNDSELYSYGAVAIRKFEGVWEEVEQDLLVPFWIAINRLHIIEVIFRIYIGLKPDLVLVCLVEQNLERLLDDSG